MEDKNKIIINVGRQIGSGGGDKVIYREYAGTDYEDDGHKYLLLKLEDVLAVVND